MIVAKIQVNGAIAKTVHRKVIPAGIIGAQVEFDYAEDIWHGLRKTVVFKGAVTKDVVTDANIVTIPPEVVEKPFFRLSIGVYGVDADGNIVIPTLWENIGAILDAAAPSGDISTDPSLPVWAQIQAMIGNLDELETTARDNLVAAVNEVAQSVGGASIAMRVDSGYIQYSTDNGNTWVNLIAKADLKGDKGDKGDKGAPGTPGKDGADGHTPVKGTDYWTASDKAEVVAEAAAAVDLTPYAKKTEVPTKTSQLTNDSRFLTSHQDISGKQDKATLEADVAAKGFTKNTGTYSKPAGGIPKADLASAVQTSLDKADSALQSVPSTYRTAAAQDVIDSGKVDKVTGKGLSSNDYTAAAKAKVDAIPANPKYTDTVYDDTALKERVATIEGKESAWDAKSDFSGSYNDLTDKPTIPTALPNPNALTIKIGSTTVTYDGSAAKTVEITDGTEVSY